MNMTTDLKNRLREKMTGTKVALLTTSDIYTINEPMAQRGARRADGVKDREPGKYGLKTTHTDKRGKITRFWTTGILELALEMGFVIWVVSTRQTPQPHDDWWRKLVPGSQTIFHGPDLAKKWKERVMDMFRPRLTQDQIEELDEEIENDLLNPGRFSCLPYMVWFQIMGLEWPTVSWEDGECYEDEGESIGPMFWTSAITHGEARGHYVTSSFFRDIQRGEMSCSIRSGTCITHGNAAGQCND